MLLNAHPQVCSAGELKATNLGDVERYRCSCGTLIKACPFWTAVSQKMACRGVVFDITKARTDLQYGQSGYTRRLLGPLHRGPLLERIRDAVLWLSPTWRTRLPEIQQRNLILIEALCEILGTEIIVDSSKIALRLKYLLATPGLEVKVIRLIRDGRAVALTYMEDPSLKAGGGGSRHPFRGLSIREAAYRWCRSIEEAENILKVLAPSQWIGIRYEDLCTETEAVLSRMFGFLGVDSREATRDFRSVEHHVVGNGMRLNRTSEVRLDERWKSVLTADDLRQFDAVAGKMNRRYGYA
jgi:hypothetical protein